MMDKMRALRQVGRLIMIVATIALLVALTALPNRPPPGWGWFILITGLVALGMGIVTARVKRQLGQIGENSFFTSDVDASPLWVVIRVYLGSIWLQAGLVKLFSPGWTQGGKTLKDFWTQATQSHPGSPPAIPYPWYSDLLHFMLTQRWYTWFAWVIAITEFSVGMLLIFGLFTGLAALAGGTLNLLYLTAGSIYISPVMLILSIFLLLAWRVAGYMGMDRFVLPTVAGWLSHFSV